MIKKSKKKVKVSKLKIIVSIIILLAVAAGGYFVYNFVKDKNYILTEVIDNETSKDVTVTTMAGFLKGDLEAPVKEGYTFLGWYVDENLTTEFNRLKHRITSDMTIYAKFTINSFNLAFDTEGGSSVDNLNFNYNSIPEEPEEPEKADYLFTGWYKDEGLTERYSFDELLNENTNLYAGWTLIDDALTYTEVAGKIIITGYKAGIPELLVIPDLIDGKEVNEISTGAFLNCVTLRELRIKSIDILVNFGIIEGCTNIESLTVPIKQGMIGNLGVYYNCYNTEVPQSLRKITLTEGTLKILSGACYGIKGLKEVILPDSVIALESGAFSSCDNLEIITIPSSVTLLGSGCFSNCISLEEITIPSSITVLPAMIFGSCSSLKEVNLSNSITRIEETAFVNCTELEEIELPDNVTIMGNAVFYGCSKLKNIKIPSELTELKMSTFGNCTSLISVEMNNKLSVIGNGCFSNCTNLSSINFPSSLTVIESSAFSDCWRLNNIVLPGSITEIKAAVFINCTSLSDITFSEGITKICSTAFINCSTLKTVTLPLSLTVIEAQAFYMCTSLDTVIVPSETPPAMTTGDAFYGCSQYIKIYVPENKVSIYRDTAGWAVYGSKINAIEND